jgi:hypothetical protein
MNALTLWGCECLLLLALAGVQRPGSSPTIPAPFPRPESPSCGLPIDQPPVVVHGQRQQPPNFGKMKKQADQLAKLAQSVPGEVDKVGKGEMPKQLLINLKQIDKLSKQLRRELAR